MTIELIIGKNFQISFVTLLLTAKHADISIVSQNFMKNISAWNFVAVSFAFVIKHTVLHVASYSEF